MYHTRPSNHGGGPGAYGGPPQGPQGGKGQSADPQNGMGPGGGGPQPPMEPDWTIKENVSDFEKENDFVQFFKYVRFRF